MKFGSRKRIGNIRVSYICRRSSVVEQHFCKVKVVGSIPTAGSELTISAFKPILFLDLN